MENARLHLIPQHLDAPFKIILWTMDEVVALLVPIILCWYGFASPLIGFTIGAICLVLVKRFKGEQGQFFLIYWWYWMMPTLWRFKCVPPSYQRHWIG